MNEFALSRNHMYISNAGKHSGKTDTVKYMKEVTMGGNLILHFHLHQESSQT